MSNERAGSLFFLIVGIYGLIFSTQLPLGKWDQPGAGMFPLCLSILLFLSGVLWFIRGKGEVEEQVKTDWHELVKNEVMPLKIVMLTGAFILAFKPLGYLLGSSLYLFLLFLWVSRLKFWVAIGLAIGIGVGSWYGFGKFLAVSFPRGLLPL